LFPASWPLFSQLGPETMETNSEILQTARDLYACDDIQIDDGAALSETDSGTWVAAWVWVPKPEDNED
jgi:hypothetical protein